MRNSVKPCARRILKCSLDCAVFCTVLILPTILFAEPQWPSDFDSKVEKRIADLEAMIANVKVVDGADIKTDVAGVGSKVKILYVDEGEESEYTIVGPTEADPLAGKISDDSPVGRALHGHRAGDVVTVNAPAGAIQLKIVSVEN